MGFRFILAAGAALSMAGCASLPDTMGYAETNALIEQAAGHAPLIADQPTLERDSGQAPVPAAPITVDQAVRMAFLYNPEVRVQYARLGLGRAALDDARRLANPGFGYVNLENSVDGGRQITRSLAFAFTDILLQPTRAALAKAELERLRFEVAANLLTLAANVESAWYEHVSAVQVARMRGLVAQAAEQSAELAQRFYDAGNITALQLAQERAAASQARINAVRADAAARQARSALANWLGLPDDGAWQTRSGLPAPAHTKLAPADLLPLALRQRLDLSGAQRELALKQQELKNVRRWRWLGAVELGYERESEPDGSVMRGPELSLELPIFNQGQGAIANAQAHRVQAQAALDALTLELQNQVRERVAALDAAADIVARYQKGLLPQRESIVARTNENVNYMLMGVFELIRARQDEFDAYQEYLEAVRDYWLAQVALKAAVGGRLPGEADAPALPDIDLEPMLPSPKSNEHDHHHHDHAHGGTP